jgi:hypothetical protein
MATSLVAESSTTEVPTPPLWTAAALPLADARPELYGTWALRPP